MILFVIVPKGLSPKDIRAVVIATCGKQHLVLVRNHTVDAVRVRIRMCPGDEASEMPKIVEDVATAVHDNGDRTYEVVCSVIGLQLQSWLAAECGALG